MAMAAIVTRTAPVKTMAGTSAAIGASTAGIRTAAVATAALRPLETGARIAANAGGVSRKILARSAGSAWRASFAWKKNRVIVKDDAFADGFGSGGFDELGLGGLFENWFGIGIRFGIGLSFRLSFRLSFATHGDDMLGGFLSGVGGKISAIGGAMSFDFGGVLGGET